MKIRDWRFSVSSKVEGFRGIAFLGVLLAFFALTACQRRPTPAQVALPLPTAAPKTLNTAVTAATSTQSPADFWTLPAQMFIVRDNLAYVAAGENGLRVFDMSAPENPVVAASFSVNVQEIVAYENELYVIGCRRQCVYTFDLSGETPELVGKSFTVNSPDSILALTAQAETVYLAMKTGVIYAAATREFPWKIISSKSLPGAVVDLDSQRGFLYATTNQGVYLFDVAEPAAFQELDFYPAPKPVWHKDTPGTVYETAVNGEQIILAAGRKGARFLHHFVDSEDRQTVDFWDNYFYHTRGEATAVQQPKSLVYVKSLDEITGQYYLTILRTPVDGNNFTPLNLIGEYALGTADPGTMTVWNGRVYFANNGITQVHLPKGYEETAGTPLIAPAVTEPPAPEVQFVRQLGGYSYTLDVFGKTAYVGLGKFLYIYDISTPQNPVEKNVVLFSEAIREIKIHNGYAYMRMEGFEWGYLLVLDVSEPENPVEVSKVPLFVQDMAFVGDRAYVIHGYYIAATTFEILDISDPANIQTLGSFTTPFREDAVDEKGVSVAWANRYMMRDLAVTGDYAFIGWGDAVSCQNIECAGGLLTLDISDEANPVEYSVVFWGAVINSVTVSNQTLFAVDQFGQLLVFDVSEAKNPRRISILEAEINGLPEAKMVVTGNELWIADGRNGLRRFNTANLSRVTEKSGYQTEASAQMVALQNDLIYLVSAGAGLEILQEDDNTRLVPLTAVPVMPNASDVVINATAAYIADNERGLAVWDISHPHSPKRIGDFVVGKQYPSQLILDGDRLYARSINLAEDIFDSRYTIDLFDVSQPDKPVYQLTLPFVAKAFTVVNGRAYVVDGNQLSIWDMTYPANPALLGSYTAAAPITGRPAVVENTIYLPVEPSVLLVLDSGDLNNIQPIYSIDEIQGIHPVLLAFDDLQTDGNYLYSVSYRAGLLMFDISNPEQPVFINIFAPATQAFMAAQTRIYTLAERDYEVTFRAYDVSDVTNIKQISDFSDNFAFFNQWPGGLAALDNTIYAAVGVDGLLIFSDEGK